MRFQVPQFIEIEDKIVGPLTLKQFVYLAGGLGMCAVIYRLLPFIIAVPLIAAIFGLALALSFYKLNNKPFVDLLQSAFEFYFGNKLYIWKKRDREVVIRKETETSNTQIYVPKLSDSRLKELTWSLDIKENPNPVTREIKLK